MIFWAEFCTDISTQPAQRVRAVKQPRAAICYINNSETHKKNIDIARVHTKWARARRGFWNKICARMRCLFIVREYAYAQICDAYAHMRRAHAKIFRI